MKQLETPIGRILVIQLTNTIRAQGNSWLSARSHLEICAPYISKQVLRAEDQVWLAAFIRTNPEIKQALLSEITGL